MVAGVGELTLDFEAEGARFVVQAPEDNGFLRAVLPPDGLRVDFDLALGWSSRTGIYFRGGATAQGLHAVLPVHRSLLGLVEARRSPVLLRPDIATREIQALVATTADVTLGPFRAAVEEMGGGPAGLPGREATWARRRWRGLPRSNGRRPFARRRVVTGRASLRFDRGRPIRRGVPAPRNRRSIAQRRQPAERACLMARPASRWSLVTAASFTPVPLGFGFTLNGVGRLLGVHRSASIPALRDAALPWRPRLGAVPPLTR
jgi:hypothetical protein